MLCTLRVRRSPEPGEAVDAYDLQVTSKHAVGGAGGLLQDSVRYDDRPILVATLNDLGVTTDTLFHPPAELARAFERGGWLTLGTDIQIPFETLTNAGFYLEERTRGER